jgi:hypothetical protein
MYAQSVSLGRRAVLAGWLVWSLFPVIGRAALPPGVEGRSVRIRLDDSAIHAIPGDERVDVKVEEDHSSTAQAMILETPKERAVPIILIVVGVLSIPVIWDTVHEMLRREYYGGVVIDARHTPALITHDKILPADTVLFISADGKSERYESRNISEELLGKLLKS